jgi:hypothetical protein
MYKLRWHPGQENLADYQSKHHAMSHHINVPPWYLQIENSPRFLPRAQKPSALKGCVGTLNDGYVCKVPLPRAPQIQSASHVACHGALKCDGSNSLHSTPRVNSTLLHSNCIRAAPRIQSTSHVTCYGAVMHDGSTPTHSTPLAYKPAAQRIQSAGHVTCYGAGMCDRYTPLHSTPLHLHTNQCTYVPLHLRMYQRLHGYKAEVT